MSVRMRSNKLVFGLPSLLHSGESQTKISELTVSIKRFSTRISFDLINIIFMAKSALFLQKLRSKWISRINVLSGLTYVLSGRINVLSGLSKLPVVQSWWPSLTKDCMTYQASCWLCRQTRSTQHAPLQNVAKQPPLKNAAKHLPLKIAAKKAASKYAVNEALLKNAVKQLSRRCHVMSK